MLNLPLSWDGNDIWKNIKIDNGAMTYNGYGKPQWPTCNWCGAYGMYLVSRTSLMTDREYTDWACDSHVMGWLPPTSEMVKEEIMEFPIETKFGRIEAATGTCDQCARDAKYLVTIDARYPFSEERLTLCPMHVDSYLPQTYGGAASLEFGSSVNSWNEKTLPCRLALAQFEPGDFRWRVEYCYHGHWESSHAGWYRTQEGAFLRWLEREALRAVKVEITDPELRAVYGAELARRQAEEDAKAAAAQAKAEAAAKEQQEAEARRTAGDAFWAEAEGRAKLLKGKRGAVRRTFYRRGDDPAETPFDHADAMGTIYGPLAVVRGEKSWDYNREWHVFHVPTGLTIDHPFRTREQAKSFLLLLLESGIDWEAVTQTSRPDGTGALVACARAAVLERSVPQYRTGEEAAAAAA